ncbi:hypothetical protein Bb109J_c2409 [Bdellovibrio bacteriovorus]|uniref:hypothetical protein n=2 Tax=Bdellovibrio bacteriovorus TaxID=959 RepID=UPI001D05A6DF|nr:hypothetical protein [Bdellovibrio bacteriovorus]BEV68989.1 hypothetical protein Bb109J_c2409 [Bdellovibrio bacteriovorus]
MNDLLRKLREEHQTILKMFEQKAPILEILHFVEAVHHPLEEQELFPKIAAHPLLSQGGPLCTYFRGMELDLAPQSEPRRRLKLLHEQGLPQASAYPSFEWLNAQNPLSLPMDEHELGHHLAEAIKILLKPEMREKYPGALEALKSDYEQLLRRHIAKEDGCLFVLCEKLLA